MNELLVHSVCNFVLVTQGIVITVSNLKQLVDYGYSKAAIRSNLQYKLYNDIIRAQFGNITVNRNKKVQQKRNQNLRYS